MNSVHSPESKLADSQFRPAILKMLRESQGWNQSQLASMAGIAQGTVSKLETGIAEPTNEHLELLSKLFEVTPEYFFRGDRILGAGPGEVFHRKRSIGVRAISRLHARMNIAALMIQDLMRPLEMRSILMPTAEGVPFDEIPEVARQFREQLRIPDGPVESVSEILFSLGVVLVPFDFTDDPVDAVAWPLPGSTMIVFYNRDVPDDRLRFTLMHELGHLILHRGWTVNSDPKGIESEANYFASCVLLPPNEIARDLSGLSIAKLGRLKRKWKVSMQSILYASKHHGSVTSWRQRQLWEEMSRLGIRTREPIQYDVQCEYPSRAFDEIVSIYREQLNLTRDEIQKLTKATVQRIETTLGVDLGSSNRRVVQFPSR